MNVSVMAVRICGGKVRKPFVGRLIREARQREGLTQWDLAHEIGSDQAYVSKIERQATPVSDDILWIWAPLLRVPFRDLVLARSGVREDPPWEGAVRGVNDEVDVRYAGLVPADSVRWMAMQEGDEKVRVWSDLLGAHAPETCFVVRVSGDCLAARSIVDGNYVLLREREPDERPRDGDIVMARIGDDFSLKIWSVQDQQMRLSDGDGRVVYRGSVNDDAITILGIYLAHWNKAGIRGMR